MASRITFVLFAVVATYAGPALGNGVAKFRVTDVKLKGTEATVEVAWEYSSGGLDQYKDKGKGVQFYVMPGTPPGYHNVNKDVPVGTVDMAEGSGFATLKVDISKVSAKPGDQITMWAFWPDTNHKWGVDKDRPGGEITLPAQNSGLHRMRPLWVSSVTPIHGWGVPASPWAAPRYRRILGAPAPWTVGATVRARHPAPLPTQPLFLGGRRR